MSLILNIECSTQRGSVNLAADGKTIHQIIGNEESGLSSEITLLIKSLLDKAKEKVETLEAIAISLGPGSYTSLRIGMSVAKGLCYGADLPLIGIPTLELLANNAIEFNNKKEAYYISLIDARRMDVYVSVYNERGEILLPACFVTLTEQWFEQWRNKENVISGNCTEKIRTLNKIEATLKLSGIKQSAEIMSKPSHEYYTQKNFIDLAYSVPYYLKPPNITKAKNIL
jgi:tRNA threonylcarbamoyladenosine biosynthesis protein TsaB